MNARVAKMAGLVQANFLYFRKLPRDQFRSTPQKAKKKTCLVQCPQFFYFPLEHRYPQLLHNLTIEIDNLYKRILYLLTRVGTHSRLFIIEGRSLCATTPKVFHPVEIQDGRCANYLTHEHIESCVLRLQHPFKALSHATHTHTHNTVTDKNLSLVVNKHTLTLWVSQRELSHDKGETLFFVYDRGTKHWYF